MALTQISTDGVKNDAISAGKIPANAVGSSEIADDAVGVAQIADDGVAQAAVADEAIDEARLQISNAGSDGQFLQKQSGNTGGLTWATVTVPDSDKIEEGNTSVETVDTGTDGHVKITNEGTETARFSSDGALLIGTTSGTHRLTVQGGGTEIAKFIGTNSADLIFRNSTSNHLLVYTGTGDSLLLGTDGQNERFRIDNEGKLGIGGANFGTSGQVLTSQGTSAAPQWADATSAAMGYDLWCVTADFGYYREWNKTHALGSAQTFTNDGGSGDASGGPGPATMSISRCTTSQNPLFVKVGTGMSMSNGVWTFPNTGEWRVTFAPQMTAGNTGGEATQNMFIYTTSNNGTDWHSTYKRRGRSGRYTYRSITAGPLIARFKITDTSNQKVKFGVGDGDVRLKMEGATDMVESHFVFEQIS